MEALLDRDQEMGAESTGLAVRTSWPMSIFKVASYVTKEVQDEVNMQHIKLLQLPPLSLSFCVCVCVCVCVCRRKQRLRS